jgi:hypothetical protein
VPDYLEQFFAVTVSGSLYRANCTGGKLSLLKLAMVGTADASVGQDLVALAKPPEGVNQIHIGAAKTCPMISGYPDNSWSLYLYTAGVWPTSGKPMHLGTHDMFYNNTSQIVGLFLLEDEASICLAEGDGSYSPLDDKYWLQTCATLEAIGADHPHFVGFVRMRELAKPATEAEIAI